MLGNVHDIFCHHSAECRSFKNLLFQISFQECDQSAKQFGSISYLDPNCLQRLSAEDKYKELITKYFCLVKTYRYTCILEIPEQTSDIHDKVKVFCMQIGATYFHRLEIVISCG